MCPIIERRKVVMLWAFATLTVLCGFNTLWGQQAQERVYASSQDNNGSGLLYSVSDPENAVDGDTESAATLSTLLGLGVTAWIQPEFPQTVPAGTTTHIKLGINPDLLGVGANITFRAYNNGSPVGEAEILSSVLSLLNGEYREEALFTPSDNNGIPVAYDAVRISLTSLLSVGLNINVYHAYYRQDATAVVCNVPEEVLYGSIGALLSGVNQVENPLNSIDGDYNSYTHLRSNVGVADKTYIKALFNTLSREGDSVRVVFQNPGGGLLDASLLASSFSIRTYNDNTNNGALALDENLLSLSLLPGSSDVQVLTYPVDAAFNRIEVAIGEGLLNVLGSLYVYEIGRISKAPDVVNGLVYACFGEEVTLQVDQPVANSDYHWYTEASGGTSFFSGTSYTPDTTITGISHFYVSEVREGCTDESGRTAMQLTVSPSYGNPELIIGNAMH